jgi:hypothetical protein
MSVCVCVQLYISAFLNGSSPNIPWVMTRLVGYIFCVCTQRARVRAKRVHSLIFGWIIFKFAGKIYYESPQVAWAMYCSCSITACARARVVKHSLIFGRILSKYAENILRIATSCMCYVFLIFTHNNVI